MKKKTLNYESKLYFWEQLLLNISRCRNKNRFIFKSDLKKLDTKNSLTIALKNMTINKYNIYLLFKEICYYPSKVLFKLVEINEVNNNHNRVMYRLVLEGKLNDFKTNLKLYIEKGNNQFPKGTVVNYKTKFGKKVIPLCCYTNSEFQAEAFYNVVIKKSTKEEDLKAFYAFLKNDKEKLINVFEDIMILEHKNYEINLVNEYLINYLNLRIKWDNINKKYQYNLEYLELIDLINNLLERKKTTYD